MTPATMTSARTYLDHNATAPLRPQARAAMLAAFDLAGNASSVHAEGRRARAMIETAREKVAAFAGARPEQVVFTSGATEANNWALSAGWRTIIQSAIEHESVLAPARALGGASGAHLIEIGCTDDGRVRVEDLADAISKVARDAASRALVSLQTANSETGVLQPVMEIAQLAHTHGLLVHTDAVQAAGRVPLEFRTLGVDLMSLSAHKLGGPKGAGALVMRDGLDLPAFMQGGSQERRRRAGTENIAAIAGFGAAVTAAADEIATMREVERLRDELERGVGRLTPSAVVIGAKSARLPNTSCIAVPGVQAAMLLIKLDLAGVAVSAGSACSSGKIGGSHVLAAMGLPKAIADAAIRISLGPTSTKADIQRFLDVWDQIHGGKRDVTKALAQAPTLVVADALAQAPTRGAQQTSNHASAAMLPPARALAGE